MNPIYTRIRDLAVSRKISLAKLSKQAGISDGSISTWKRQEPAAFRVKAVADALGVSIDYLIGSTDKPDRIKEIELNQNFADVVFTFDGQPISKANFEIIKQILKS